MQGEVCGSRWVGCDISWWNSSTLVKNSSYAPSIIVLSLVHQTEDLALKSPQVMVNRELHKVVSLKLSQNLTKNFQTQNYLGSETYIQHQHNPCYFVQRLHK